MDAFQKIIKNFYTDFGTLNLVPHIPSSLVSINDVWVDFLIRSESDISGSYLDILGQATSSQFPMIAEGHPGAGKSMLVKKICYDWAQGRLDQFDFVLLAKLRDLKNIPPTGEILQLALQWLSLNCAKAGIELEEVARVVGRVPKERILILLDGLDEALPKCLELEALMSSEDALLAYPTLITTRPYKALEIRSNHSIFTFKGFSLAQQVEFIQKHVKASQMLNRSVGERLIAELKTNRRLRDVLSIPLLLYLACLSQFIPSDNFRETDLYLTVCQKLFSTGSWMEMDLARNLGKLAFWKLLEDEDGVLNFTEEDMRSFAVDPIASTRCGFLCEEKSDFAFIHKSIQEFFAAITFAHLLKTSPSEFEDLAEKVLKLNSDSGNQILMFFFGLTANFDSEKVDRLLQSVLLKELNLKPSFGIWGFLSCNYRYFIRILQECRGGGRATLAREIISQSFFSPLLFENSPPMELLIQICHPDKLRRIYEHVYVYDKRLILFHCENEQVETDFGKKPRLAVEELEEIHFSGDLAQLEQISSKMGSGLEKLTLELHGDNKQLNLQSPRMKNLRNLQFSISEFQAQRFSPITQFQSLLKNAKHLVNLSIFGAQHSIDMTFLSHASLFLDRIILYKVTLDSASIGLLAQEIKRRKTLSRLSIVECNLRAGLLDLVRALQIQNELWYLDISSNHTIGKNQDLFKAFCAEFPLIESLTCLCLNDCALTDSLAVELKRLEQKRLRELYLKGNRFTETTKRSLKEINFVRI